MRLLLSTALLTCVLAFSGCDSAEHIRSTEVFLANDSATPTHLLTDTEDFSPSNQVAPGEDRNRMVSYRTDNDDPLVFRAGRNGQVLATAACPHPRAAGQYVVRYSASGALLCPDFSF